MIAITRPFSGRARIKRAPRVFRAAFVALFFLATSISGIACSVWGTGVVWVAGSTTLLPLAQEAADRYMDMHGDVTVLVQGGGSSVGIAQVKEGIIDIADSSRELKPDEEDEGLTDIPIAFDIIAIVVHPGVGIDGLSSQQTKDIFTGAITNWREVGGGNAPIICVVRDRASGTREMFDQEALDKEDSVASAIECNSNGIVRETVASTPNSIGYISLGYVNSSIKALSYDGVFPAVDSAKDKSYPLSRYLHMFTYGAPRDNVQAFIEYVLSEEFQTEVVSQEYIPVLGM